MSKEKCCGGNCGCSTPKPITIDRLNNELTTKSLKCTEPKKVNSIALEDLVTVVCETFVEELKDMDNVDFVDSGIGMPLWSWYIKCKTDSERKEFSEILLDRMENMANQQKVNDE
tara:strand:+ start:2388 stop:2732 length:345 start_codon:yes stop_codon:yes gene_type:complete